jgi:hypothetical protein
MKKFFILFLLINFNILYAQQDQGRVYHTPPKIKDSPDTTNQDTIKKASQDQMPVLKSDTNVIHPRMNVKKPKSMEPMPIKKLPDTLK